MRASWPRPVEPTKQFTCEWSSKTVIAIDRPVKTYCGQTVVDGRNDEGIAHPNEASCGQGYHSVQIGVAIEG